MKATVLIDNISNNELICEWGFSAYIEYNSRKILLDTGTTGSFVKNASSIGIPLEEVEYGVLSHAHYDHADGMEEFFSHNHKAKFYLRKSAAENCYYKMSIFHKYIGIKKGYLKKYQDRIVYVDGDYELCPGVYLIPHKTPGLESQGQRANMYVREHRKWKVETFAHEQSLVFDTPKGLVVFNSCSHGGADNIIKEVSATFPDKQMYALIGGFHLFKSSEKEVRALADRIKETGIEKVITGHCTGNKSFEILKKELGDKVLQFYTGMEMEF